ncbi:MlaA family lipoprotein [Azospirillum picis]|uniref:Phospholipid-binding lipoprotein MlaA n=1 Tax=Azospirillum picis TaxID=488438 RepID=A0ABU0MEV7_9PROT|nr:VacJ family lipoprotein [Azospirillum picis]MBP2298114.1 phospholipid-binding lipoprotein MlaA [Azospirillum picis]MDQ0531952.1 phospholipid-binding lipoprotein MlaA [Azospirillum picis]
MKLARLSRSLLRTATVVAFALTATACATNQADSGATDAAYRVNDPLEIPNRFVFAANEAADILVIRPAAEVYVGVVPDPVRDVISNFIDNLMSPLYIANNLLQGNVEGASNATGRFLTNTILGVGGLADVATEAGIPRAPEDFGQTLAVWGVGDGPYLVLPLLGPSNLRDTAGYAVDTVGDPFRIWAYGTDHKDVYLVRGMVGAVDRRSQILREVDDLRRNSVDFYATVRSLYQQQRRAEISNNKAPATPEFPDFTDAPKP